jgi:hypothetical protein
MPLKSEPYYFVVCDGCGQAADYDDYTAWKDPGTAIDMAIDSEWTRKDETFHCTACPSLDPEEGTDEH